MKQVVLLTDFGTADGYVGVMKGIIAGLSPQTQCIDLSHDIGPQDIWAGRFCLMNHASYFPQNTVFLGVIDPGVGSKRRGIAVQFAEGYFFVGPDNGLISGLLNVFEAIAAVKLTNRKYWRTSDQTNISNTFHGRDIFAPVAAHIAEGVHIKEFGESTSLEQLKKLEIPPYSLDEKKIIGSIQHIDHFGNLITTIPNHVEVSSDSKVYVGDRPIPIVQTYSDVMPHTPCALRGSHGWFEISINQGNASIELKITRGDKITINQKKGDYPH